MSKQNNLFITGICNILEWVDYSLYGGFVFIISETFFPKSDVYTSTIYAYLVFAAGFIARPIGGAIFGHIADKFGRERSLFYSICLMIVPTVAIGFLPGYAVIGVVSTLVLFLCRLLQGIAIGGEYTGAMVHMVETAPVKQRGFVGSFAEVGCLVGVLIGGELFTAILEKGLSRESYFNWGWRIPFIASVLIFILAYKVKSYADKKNTTTEVKSSEDYVPLLELVKRYKKTCFYVSLSSACSGVNFYVILVFIPNYLVTYMNVDAFHAFGACALITVLMVIAVLCGGYLSDKLTRKSVMIPAMVAIILLEYPMMAYIGTYKGAIYQTLCGLCLALYFGGRPAFFAEAFPKKLRCTAVSVCLSISHALFAGTTSVIATYITKQFGNPSYFAIYSITVSGLALYGFSKIPDRTGEPME